jgi:hypothetical protein
MVSPFPSQAYGPRFSGHIAECLNTFHGTGKHKTGLTGHEAGLCGVDVMLVPLKFDCQRCDVVVDLVVVCDLASQPPVVSVGHCHLKDLKVTTRASEHMVEPRQ